MYGMREPRDWANLGELVFGVEHHARNVCWLRASTPDEVVLLASAKRQQELSLQFQGQAKALAENLGERYSLRWLAVRLHTLNYDGAYAVLRGRTRMNLEHIEDFTQAVSEGGDTVSTVVEGPTTRRCWGRNPTHDFGSHFPDRMQSKVSHHSW